MVRVLLFCVLAAFSFPSGAWAHVAQFYAKLDAINETEPPKGSPFWEELEAAQKGLGGIKYVYLDYLESRPSGTPATRYAAKQVVGYLKGESKTEWVHFLFLLQERYKEGVKDLLLDQAINELLATSGKVYSDGEKYFDETLPWRNLTQDEHLVLIRRMQPPRHPGVDTSAKFLRAIFAMGDLETGTKLWQVSTAGSEDAIEPGVRAFVKPLGKLRSSFARHFGNKAAQDSERANKLAAALEKKGISSGLDNGLVFFDAAGSIRSLDSLTWNERRQLRLDLEKQGVFKRSWWVSFVDSCVSTFLNES